MSTFSGKIKEIEGISVDRFDGDNLKSSAYFLSHCHADHMRGLCCDIFPSYKTNKCLYTSPISKIILLNRDPRLTPYVETLSLEYPTSIKVHGKEIMVTCIPAGHCPGAVMFLFETDSCKILYTGDFRVSISDIRKFKGFYDNFNNLKVIDKVYLDTTFFNVDYPSFPERSSSMETVCFLINDWISSHKKNVVKIVVPAHIGYEYIYKNIYERLKIPVHVSQKNFDIYIAIPELDGSITTDGSLTRIHCCSLDFKMCSDTPPEHIKAIKLSARRWTDQYLNKNNENGTYCVCYSTHASYQECLALLTFLKPKDVHVCVEQDDPQENAKLFELVQRTLMDIHSNKEEKIEDVRLFQIQEKYDVEEEPKKKRSAGLSVFDSPPR